MSDLLLPGADQGLLVPPEVKLERLREHVALLKRGLESASTYIEQLEADNALLRARLLAAGLSATSAEHPELTRTQRRALARIEAKRARRAVADMTRAQEAVTAVTEMTEADIDAVAATARQLGEGPFVHTIDPERWTDENDNVVPATLTDAEVPTA